MDKRIKRLLSSALIKLVVLAAFWGEWFIFVPLAVVFLGSSIGQLVRYFKEENLESSVEVFSEFEKEMRNISGEVKNIYDNSIKPLIPSAGSKNDSSGCYTPSSHPAKKSDYDDFRSYSDRYSNDNDTGGVNSEMLSKNEKFHLENNGSDHDLYEHRKRELMDLLNAGIIDAAEYSDRLRDSTKY